MAAKEPRLLTWGFPLAGLAGTIAGLLITFTRIGTEPQSKTVLVGLGFGSVVAVVTASGARDASRRTLLLAGGIFVAACVAVVVSRYYADELLGKHSLIR